jgi:hypothetical protein
MADLAPGAWPLAVWWLVAVLIGAVVVALKGRYDSLRADIERAADPSGCTGHVYEDDPSGVWIDSIERSDPRDRDDYQWIATIRRRRECRRDECHAADVDDTEYRLTQEQLETAIRAIKIFGSEDE